MPLQNTIQLTLETMEAKDLDAYIAKNFNSSEEIRKKYSSKINPFLEQYKALIDRVERETGKKFSGSIVITELDENLVLERKRVIYKKEMILFRKVTQNKKFLLALEKRDYINKSSAINNNKKYKCIFSDFFGKELRFYCHSDNKFQRVVGQWRNAIKESYYYYDIVRATLKEYENRYKELGLPSLDVIYSQYLRDMGAKKTARRTVEVEEDLEATIPDDRLSQDLLEHLSDYEEPKRYRTYADEEGYPGDLEYWGQDVIPDDELEDGMEKGRVKTLNNGHHILLDQES